MATAIVFVLLVGVLALVVRSLIRQRKQGGCAGCPGGGSCSCGCHRTPNA